MRKLRIFLAALFVALAPLPVNTRALAAETESPAAEEAAVASEDEQAARSEVGHEGMVPVTADMLENGSYRIGVDTDTSMFRVTDAELRVADGKMTAVLTLGGKGYGKIYMGTAEEAAAAPEESCAPFKEDADGRYTYEVEVPILNEKVDCAAYSTRKEKWYGHLIVFDADTLPEGAVKKVSEAWTETAPVVIDKKDGVYTAEVSLSGGTGKASVTSPAKVTVQGKTATAELVWSSPNYDYMIAGGQKYLPVNSEGNSTFSIPVTVFDAPVTVLADTTAMSVPHEIEYQLVFDSATLAPERSEAAEVPFHLLVILLGGICGLIWIRSRKKRTL
ncbi:MAG: hypothetical protein K6E83_04470 [Clostridium sp.]|nr:hypothetical protein [Clostridium sp.]